MEYQKAQMLDKAKLNGFRFNKVQREAGCMTCQFFDLEAAIKEKPYCLAPVAFGDTTIEKYRNTDAEGPGFRYRCHKHQRIEGLNGSEAPILDNGRRKVASPVNTGVSYD